MRIYLTRLIESTSHLKNILKNADVSKNMTHIQDIFIFLNSYYN